MPSLISVTIVTYNSERYIDACLESVFLQQYQPLEVIVVDNASQDATLKRLQPYRDRIRLILNSENLGFAAGQNQAIAASSGEWVLALNPDVYMTPGFIARMMRAGENQNGDHVGTVCGKLLRMTKDLTIPSQPVTDSTGIFFTPMLRHFDRGSLEVANGHYERQEYVFGASAAAALYRRDMIQDISVRGEFFDPDFFMYREDADVAWRAQLMGWKCLYVPHAVGYHVRTVHCWNRSQVPPVLNMHSVKNRFLMRLKNIGSALYLRNFSDIALRDLAVFAYCLLFERTSLPAFMLLARGWRRAWEKRLVIQKKRRVSDRELAHWFRYQPVALPVSLHHLSVPAGSIAVSDES
jgi:GT2 family glycosyltransferase